MQRQLVKVVTQGKYRYYSLKGESVTTASSYLRKKSYVIERGCGTRIRQV